MKVIELRDVLHELPEDAEIWFRAKTVNGEPETLHAVKGMYVQTNYFDSDDCTVMLTGYRVGS